ncbi:hypothetical protein AJ80_09851 [Polytolypa hystricis UAMH7299]|uniref:C2 domain-containing protein n=1 Tax=Polytolypa hystricis (strain UAMH7299) TaxID=1447883 RepID=A0A2B7WHN5_POLH7|nr:hypothetical protein AJ80_09851 [Polytolypa hystricis UAMH7299]
METGNTQATQHYHKHPSEFLGQLVGEPENIQNNLPAGAPAVHKLLPSTKLPGGFDATPIPHAAPGFTLKFIVHRAANLPIGDLSSLSSDPFVALYLKVDLPRRHKQDPDVVFRTPTIRKSVNPVWDCEWVVANVPASGFQLKCRIYDEDPINHDDRLGNVRVDVEHLHDAWVGIKNQPFKIRRRMASKRSYLLTALTASANTTPLLFISIECLGKTLGTEGGQMYTVGPNMWTQHFSPLIGMLAGTRDSEQGRDGSSVVTRYNFQAIQIQLKGPVPPSLYHRYVEFKPFVAGMFTSRSLRGRILNRALHHQHARIYNFSRSTVYGMEPSPSALLTKQFLEFVHHGQGGKVFTYVLTLDGQLRFTETGKEFRIDMLSKHTMHSDVSIYIAYSGEFFIRKLRHGTRDSSSLEPGYTHDPPEGPSIAKDASLVLNDLSTFELVIDNDSGTYRPSAECLPQLQEFLSMNLPGLRVTTLDCQRDAELLSRLKSEQRDRKVQTARQLAYIQETGSASSISNSGVDGS